MTNELICFVAGFVGVGLIWFVVIYPFSASFRVARRLIIRD